MARDVEMIPMEYEKQSEPPSIWRRLLDNHLVKILTPSFLHKTAEETPSKPQRPTAWLDGLRGVAAFLVFVYHFHHMFHDVYRYGYGSNGGNNDHWLIQLPVLRMLPNGQTQVSVFYVLSGVSLSLRPLELARNHAWEKCFDNLFSAVFRRWLRLYLPVYAVQSVVLLATLLGLYNHAYALTTNWPFAGTNEMMHVVMDSKWAQIYDWIQTMWDFANPFLDRHWPGYDVHLWTIPVEFVNSIRLFATLLGFAKLRPAIRVSLTIAIWAYCIRVNRSEVAVFYAGMAIAEFILSQDKDTETIAVSKKRTFPGWRTILSHAGWCAVAYAGLHLLSWPAVNSHASLGFITLNKITPEFIVSAGRTWERIGACVFVFGLSGCAMLRRPFATRFAIYLGNISFSLYIVHGPLNHILGFWVLEFFWKLTGTDSLVAYEAGVILAFCTMTIVVVYVADIVMRVVDRPSVKLGRVLQKLAG
jgi:peptidoglycan/LPS O-acetylase OafA/YrhL